MSFHGISNETFLLVGIILSLFLLAMVCLASALDCSLCRCCSCCKRQSQNQEDEESQQQYDSLNEFIFESNDDETAGLVSMEEQQPPSPMTMSSVFPDLLAGEGETNNDINNNDNDDTNNSDMREPLL